MYVQHVAEQRPDARAVVIEPSGVSHTFSSLEDKSAQLAKYLTAEGLRPGDYVAMLLENSLEYFEAAVAFHRIGLIYVAISTHLSADEIGFILKDSGAKLLITSAGLLRRKEGLPGHVGDITTLVVGGGEFGRDYEAELTRVDPSTELCETAGCPMLYSSGTTGRPKGVKFSRSGQHPRLFSNPLEKAVTEKLGLGPERVFLLPSPMYHTSPHFYADLTLRAGGTVVVMERFDAAGFLAAVEKHHVTHSFVVPTMLLRLLKLPDEAKHAHDISSLQWCQTGAAPCPPEAKQAIMDWWGPILWEGYGGSERNGVTTLSPQEAFERPGSVGRSVGDVDIVILDEGGRELAAGEQGRVYFRGGFEFEYHNEPVKTQEAYAGPATSTLGDIGYVDADGFLYLTDRESNLIITGGVNVYPQESEMVLAMHPDVADVAVIGVPHPDMGESVTAVVVPKAGVSAGPELGDRIMAYCGDRIAHYKCPTAVEFVDELPRTPTGKLVKRKISLPSTVRDDRSSSEDHHQERTS